MINNKPNIVFVLTDDQGYADLGCMGNPWLKTPNIDSFYNESVRLTNFHVGPTCAPTRAGLMTGHYANSTGVWHTIGGRSLLRRNECTIASALKESGYKTAIFGKWHLGDEYPYRPQDRGFDTTMVHGGGGISQTPDFWGNDYFDDTYFINGKPQKFSGYCTDVFFGEAMKFIEDNKDRPFFCYVATNAPHSPYNVEKKYSDLYIDKMPEDRARFYGMITNIDENFSKLKEKLKDLNLEDNTILIFMSDNGTSCGAEFDKDGFVIDGYNAGLRGGKGSKYDGGHKVPFFIRYPDGEILGGRDVHELTANIDFMPTLLELCGVPVKKEYSFHGKSIARLLTGRVKKWEQRVIITDSQRLTNPIKWRQCAVMTNRWRLIDGKELNDITLDKEQRFDVADQFPNVVTKLRKEYEAWWNIVSKQFEEEIPILVGEKPNMLTCHDIRNENSDCAWHQGHIRRGYRTNGYWELEIEKDGEYVIELRRWPKETDRAIIKGIDGDDVVWSQEWIQEKNRYMYSGGESLPVKYAKVEIQGSQYVKSIGDCDTSIVFHLLLNKGKAHLTACFADDKDLNICAYYVSVFLKK